MKGNKKILVIAALLLLIVATYTTYAIYKSSATGDASISTAAWVVKVEGTDITANNTFTVDSITWNTPTISKVANKIAPGDSGYVDIVIDADGSEVDVYYEVTFGDLDDNGSTVTNDHLSATAHSGSSLTGTIPYSATDGDMERTVRLDVTWVAEDNATQNPIDVNTAGKDLTLPVTVTVRQNPAS